MDRQQTGHHRQHHPADNDLSRPSWRRCPPTARRYTAIVRGVNDTTGIAVVKLFMLNYAFFAYSRAHFPECNRAKSVRLSYQALSPFPPLRSGGFGYQVFYGDNSALAAKSAKAFPCGKPVPARAGENGYLEPLLSRPSCSGQVTARSRRRYLTTPTCSLTRTRKRGPRRPRANRLPMSRAGRLTVGLRS